MLDLLRANPWLAGVLAYAVLNEIAGRIPSHYHSAPWYGWLVVVVHFCARVTAPDKPQTFKWPFTSGDAPKVPPMPVLCLLLLACPSPLPPPSGCTPMDTRCYQGTPEVCSQTLRWTVADRECSELGAECCLVAFGSGHVHACVQAADCGDAGR